MAELSDFFVNYSTLLQQYALAEDKDNYLELLNHQNRKFFNLILNPVSPKDQQLAKELGLSPKGQNQLRKTKLSRELKSAQTINERQNLIQQILLINPEIKQMISKNNNELMRTNSIPSQNSFFNPNSPAQRASNLLITEKTVEEVVKRVIQENPHNITQLTAYGFRNLTAATLKKVEDRFITAFMKRQQEVIRSFDPQELAELLEKYFFNLGVTKQRGQDQQFPPQFYEIMTTEQIQAVKARFPKLFDNFSSYQRNFRLKYQTKLKNYKGISLLSFQEQQEKKLLCIQILKQLEQEKSIFSFFYIEKITEEILLLEEALVDCNIQRFISYLTRIRTINYDHLNPQFKQKIKDFQGKNKFIDNCMQKLTFLDSSRFNQPDLINKTITCLFKQGQADVLQRLSPYISRNYLIKEEAKVKLSKGLQKEITNLYEVLTTTELNQLKSSKYLSFSPRNKKFYHQNDKVELVLTSKNIKQITTKIYEVDLQKHYLSGKSQIDQSINLKFLMPKCQPKLFAVACEDPFVEQTITIELPDLQNDLGMFVVDLQGEQITSRAVIRKGMINVQSQITPIGCQLTFYNQDGEHIPQLVLWRNGNKVQVESSYVVPFGTMKSQQIIAVYKNYAQKEVISLVQENYLLTADYIFNSESFIVGQKAKIVIRPKLILFKECISLQRLSNATIKVIALSNLKVPSTQTHQNIKFKDNEDFVLQIPIKSYVEQVAIQLQVEIERIDKTVQTIKRPMVIPIDVQEANNCFVDLYLNKCQKGMYKLQVKGLNGQPIPQAPAVFKYRQFGANHQFRQSLVSDSRGIFKLGSLTQVRTLTVAVTNNQIQTARTWRINNLGDSVSYGAIDSSPGYWIYLRQGEKLALPIPCSFDQKDLIFYHEDSQHKIYKNCIKQLKIQDKLLTASNLSLGKYSLVFLRLDKRLEIEVVKGRKWIGNTVIDKNNQIIELNINQEDLVSLGQITATPHQDHTEVDIDIIAAGEKASDIKLHIFAKNYIDSELQYTKIIENNQNLRLFRCKKQPKELTFKQSTYLSNKRLSDETAYVLNRRKQSMKTGTNLEKPLMFLKKTEVSDTALDQEQLAGESNQRKAQLPNQNKPMELFGFGGFGAMLNCPPAGLYGQPNQFNQQQQSQAATKIQNKINSHNNFISQVGYLSANTNSWKGIKVPKGYSQLVVYLAVNEHLIKREYPLPQPQLKINRQTHSKLNDKDDKVGWAICRQIHKLYPGKQQKINKSCLWNTVSKANLIQYAAALKISLPDWLHSWGTYNDDKKIEVYDKEFSHQINFFLYKNDQPFFQKVVKPFLKNRLNKTFVDLYLIDSPQTLNFASAHKLQNLNYFERALLVQVLIKGGKQAQAAKLADSMALPIKPLSKTSQAFKKFFQTILTAQKVHQAQSSAQAGFINMSNATFGMSNRAPTSNMFGASNSNIPIGASSLMGNVSNMSNISNVSNMGNMSNIQMQSVMRNMMGGNMGNMSPIQMQSVMRNMTSGNMGNMSPIQMQSVMRNMTSGNSSGFGSFGVSQQMQSAHPSYQFPLASSTVVMPSNSQSISRGRNTVAMVQQAQQQYKSGCTSEKIRQYCQTTYFGLKSGIFFAQAVHPSLFWAELAAHYCQKLDQYLFLSDKFNSFTSKREFILAISVLMSSFNSEYQLQSTEDSFLVTAKSAFLIFAKEIKACPIQQSKNLVINQRFFDNAKRYSLDQEGNQCENAIDSFVILKPYNLQTIVTNISGSNLEIQVLVDIPEGSIPLKNHNKTQIKNFTLNAYSTITFEREFYFPAAGTFNVYPANASKNDKILSKSAPMPPIQVAQKELYVKSQRLEDIMRSGTDQECFSYLRQKNIFDSNVFSSASIQPKLKDKSFFQKCIQIFKERNYFNRQIWLFSFHHKSYDLILEYLQSGDKRAQLKTLKLPIFEYHPYYSNRVHGHVQQNRCNFKIKQMVTNYAQFLAHAAFYSKSQQSKIRLVLVYYLLLQDRIKEASELRNRVSKQQLLDYQLQYDYVDCFIDVSLGAQNGYILAKKISQLYLQYPVLAWRAIFADVHTALFQAKGELEDLPREELAFFNTTVTNHQAQIKIKQSANTTVIVHIYKIDLELYFSQFPFSEIHSFSSISPQKTLQFTSASFQTHTIFKKDYLDLGDVIVEVFEQRQRQIPTKITNFLWTNPEVRVRIYEKEGWLKVLYQGKKCQAYCKVYVVGAKGMHFYKDGYTDIACTFRYAMNIDKIDQFSILVLTENGGSIVKVKPPALA